MSFCFSLKKSYFTSYKASLVMVNSICFCLSGKLSLLILKDNFFSRVFLVGSFFVFFFSFSTLMASFYELTCIGWTKSSNIPTHGQICFHSFAIINYYWEFSYELWCWTYFHGLIYHSISSLWSVVHVLCPFVKLG